MDPIPQNMYLPNVLWYPLAVDKARFAGARVAAVIAVNRYQAEDAAELVDVEYEPLSRWSIRCRRCSPRQMMPHSTPEQMCTITPTVNGMLQTVTVSVRKTLLDFVR